jgi:ABC-type antimicrobial peptide transport system permease subunit
MMLTEPSLVVEICSIRFFTITRPNGTERVLRRNTFGAMYTYVLSISTLLILVFTLDACKSGWTNAMFKVFTMLAFVHQMRQLRCDS